jgi:hypothetical protein
MGNMVHENGSPITNVRLALLGSLLPLRPLFAQPELDSKHTEKSD